MRRTEISITLAIALLSMTILSSETARAAGIESFTEPYRRIDVPAPEIGVIAEILVEEGDQVTRNQLLARLDDTVLKASLEVARAAKDSVGSLEAAEAEDRAKTEQLDSYKVLHDRGNASKREYERAVNEQLKSSARLQSVREELEVRRLEFERARAQIAQRRIQAPIGGHVVALEKEAGEFVSPNDAVVLRIVQLDSLKSVFSVPLKASRDVRSGQKVDLHVGYDNVRCQGVVEYVSPTADPQSGSVQVKVRIPNAEGKIQSGATCRWNLEGYDPTERISRTRVQQR